MVVDPRWDGCPEAISWEAMRGKQCYAGLDLSTRRDVPALVLAFPGDDGRVRLKPHFWLPADNVPTRLQPWVRAGLIETTDGNTIDYAAVRLRCNELREQYGISSVAFDPWNVTRSRRS